MRIIAATNRDMKAKDRKGFSRRPLVPAKRFPITVLPLRQRKEDIPRPWLEPLSPARQKLGKHITSISSATLQKLQDYSWPGM
jgi:transcriptional regulator with GAF, ATPase, and Fis domain